MCHTGIYIYIHIYTYYFFVPVDIQLTLFPCWLSILWYWFFILWYKRNKLCGHKTTTRIYCNIVMLWRDTTGTTYTRQQRRCIESVPGIYDWCHRKRYRYTRYIGTSLVSTLEPEKTISSAAAPKLIFFWTDGEEREERTQTNAERCAWLYPRYLSKYIDEILLPLSHRIRCVRACAPLSSQQLVFWRKWTRKSIPGGGMRVSC